MQFNSDTGSNYTYHVLTEMVQCSRFKMLRSSTIAIAFDQQVRLVLQQIVGAYCNGYSRLCNTNKYKTLRVLWVA
jgi:hypothetical protein